MLFRMQFRVPLELVRFLGFVAGFVAGSRLPLGERILPHHCNSKFSNEDKAELLMEVLASYDSETRDPRKGRREGEMHSASVRSGALGYIILLGQ
jgi:hypothetical protein